MKKTDAQESSRSPAVFLDRDGTILDELGYLGDPARMRVLPGTAEAMRILREGGFRLVVVTNQSGVARGYFSEKDAIAVNLALVQWLWDRGARPDAVLYCPHHPDAGCGCRKPEGFMIRRAAQDLDLDLERSWTVGDTASDVMAGLRSGTGAILVGTGKTEKGEVPEAASAFPDILAAAKWIVTEGKRARG